MGAEEPKKITGGAFGQYLTENRAALLKELPGQNATAAVKLASERFKAFDDVVKSKYQKMFEAARQKYEKDLAAFLSAGGEMKVRKPKKDKKAKEAEAKDLKPPEKPVGGAFTCFLQDKREEFTKEIRILQGISESKRVSVSALTKFARQQFRSLNDITWAKYQKMHDAAKQEYQQDLAAFLSATEMKDAPKKRKATSKNDAPATKRRKIAGSTQAKLEAEAEARKLGWTRKLTTLAKNVKVKSSPREIMAELHKQNGSVVAAKKALLGA